MKEHRPKLAVILPVLQVLAAMALLAVGHGAHGPRGSDTIYVSTATLLCFGINAPSIILLRSWWYFLPRTSFLFLGFSADELSFLLGVILVWYFAGRAFDRRALKASPSSKPRERLIATGLLMLGVVLLVVSWTPVRYPPGGNSLGGSVVGALFLVWSLALIAAGLRLLRRSKLAGHP